MFIVGLTGGIATGKSTVLAMIREQGIAVIDADEVAREVMQKGTEVWEQIGEQFGEEIYFEDGSINRPMLAEIVFNDANKRRKLNEITHPKIQTAIIKMAITYFFTGHPFIVMELPLLFETGRMYNFMHKIVIVICEDHQQLERLCIRNKMSTEDASLRINAQMPLAEKVNRSDYVIDNSRTIENTREQTELVINKLHECKIKWYLTNTVKVIVITVVIAYGTNFILRKYSWL